MAKGQSATQVALTGLLKKRYPHAVCEWVPRYKAEGIEELVLRDASGRKPSFSPSTTHQPGRSASLATTDPLSAYQLGYERIRGTLQMLLDILDQSRLISAHRLHSLPSRSQLFDRLGFSYKRARSHIYSPNPHYYP